MATSKEDKTELLKRIDDQQQQLEQYKKRLGDLIVAYKSLQIEKKALESSLAALGDVKSSEKQPSHIDSVKPENETSNATTGLVDDRSVNVEEQIVTLTKALTALTNEKSRMEASFLADNKQLRFEREELEMKAKKEKQKSEKEKQMEKQQVAAEVAELKKKIWSQQLEREKEHSDHAVMLRELQTLVAIERSNKEQLELQLEDLHRNLDRRSDMQRKCSDLQNKIKELSEKLDIAKKKLKESEERAEQPQPLLVKLQKELESLKDQHTSSLVQERCRANEAEEQLQMMAQMSEERVANLELKLSELSETVGNYDRIRHQDQQAINGLKERVAQLDRENSLLSGTMGLGVLDSGTKNENNDDDSNLDVHTLMGRLLKIKSLMNAANQRSENPVDLKEFLTQQGLISEMDHNSCNEELRQLKDEFERYKLRAQSVLKNKNNKESSFSREEETLRRQVVELKGKLKQTITDMEEKETFYKKLLEESNTLTTRMRMANAEEMSKSQIEFRARISDMENEIQKHRTRTIVLLEEKESEIKRLKISLGIAMYDPQEDEQSEDASDQDESRKNFSQLMLVPNDGQLLHYVQEISRKDQEIASLRRQKHQLETLMREIETAMVAKEEKSANEIEHLNSEIQRLERNVSREGANLEYLKNVVLNYMLSSDASSRHHMLNAIATLLKFSPKELTSVQQYNRAWWWQNAPKPSEKYFAQ